MDNVVDSLEAAHGDFITADAAMLEAKKASNGEDTTAISAALENLKLKYELFRVACDKADAFVESAKQKIGSECLVDEATGSVAGEPGQPGLPPINAVRLEQLSKSIRLLVLDLQQDQVGSSGGGAGSSNGGGASSSNGGGAGSSNGGRSGFNEDGGQ